MVDNIASQFKILFLCDNGNLYFATASLLSFSFQPQAPAALAAPVEPAAEQASSSGCGGSDPGVAAVGGGGGDDVNEVFLQTQ